MDAANEIEAGTGRLSKKRVWRQATLAEHTEWHIELPDGRKKVTRTKKSAHEWAEDKGIKLFNDRRGEK